MQKVEATPAFLLLTIVLLVVAAYTPMFLMASNLSDLSEVKTSTVGLTLIGAIVAILKWCVRPAIHKCPHCGKLDLPDE